MTKEEFLNQLKHNLRYLPKDIRQSELNTYANMTDYSNLNPIDIANTIYKNHNLNYIIRPKIKFLDALNILIEKLRTKDKEITKSILLFFLYLLFLLIIIKIPFIYVRDMIGTIFNNILTNENYGLYSTFFELAYALTTILIFIRLIKNKALDLEKMSK